MKPSKLTWKSILGEKIANRQLFARDFVYTTDGHHERIEPSRLPMLKMAKVVDKNGEIAGYINY